MKEDLLRFNKSQKYLIFDFETCNLNLASSHNKPWQLAFLICNGNNILESKDFYIKWDDLQVSKDAAKITGFKRAKYNKLAVDAKVVLKEFESYLYDPDYLVLGHNILGFDIFIHNIYRTLVGLHTDYSYLNRAIDTNALARGIKLDIKIDKDDDILSWQYRLVNHRKRGVKTSLIQLCKDYDIPFDKDKLHDAQYDIAKNFEIFKRQLWEIEI
jgi:DNA polymerase III epsilon subunit-like protein